MTVNANNISIKLLVQIVTTKGRVKSNKISAKNNYFVHLEREIKINIYLVRNRNKRSTNLNNQAKAMEQNHTHSDLRKFQVNYFLKQVS